jgi:aspartate 1-decarboxylase
MKARWRRNTTGRREFVQVTVLKGKIHRCTVTQADLDYEGSVTISEELMAAAKIVEHERVHIWNVTSGKRLITYAMRGSRDSGTICINGAAAHLMNVGDVVIIAAFVSLEATEAEHWRPSVVFVDSKNKLQSCAEREVPGPHFTRVG